MPFPKRTLVLMVLALLAFVWMYWQTHRSAGESAPLNAQPGPAGEGARMRATGEPDGSAVELVPP